MKRENADKEKNEKEQISKSLRSSLKPRIGNFSDEDNHESGKYNTQSQDTRKQS